MYIDIPKTGSTTVESLLTDLCEIDPNEKQKFFHMDVTTLAEVFEKNLWRWDDFFKFSVVRHPIDRLFSFHKYRLKSSEETPAGKTPYWQNFISSCVEYREKCSGSFEEAHKSFDRAESNGLLNDVRTQASYLFDKTRRITVDRVLHLETLNSDLHDLFKTLQLKDYHLKPVPTLNVSYSEHNAEALDLLIGENKHRVQRRYAVDFQTFKYQPNSSYV